MRLKEYLFYSCMTHVEFAEIADISVNYVCMLCNERKIPSKILAEKIERLTQGQVGLDSWKRAPGKTRQERVRKVMKRYRSQEELGISSVNKPFRGLPGRPRLYPVELTGTTRKKENLVEEKAQTR